MPEVMLQFRSTYRKAFRFLTGMQSFLGARWFVDNEEGSKVDQRIFRKAIDQVFSKNTLFGNVSLPVVEKSSAERRSHPPPTPKRFTVLV